MGFLSRIKLPFDNRGKVNLGSTVQVGEYLYSIFDKHFQKSPNLPMMPSFLKRFYFLLFAAASLTGMGQDSSQDKVDVVNAIVNNISWPTEPDEYVLKVVTQDRALTTAFKEMAASKQINGKPIKVSFSNYITVPKKLDILYLSAQYNAAQQTIIERIEGDNVLLITEESPDEKYIMVNFKSAGSGTSFVYNRANIANQQLSIEGDLDALGGAEVDVAALFKQTRDSARYMEAKSRDIEEQIDSLNVMTAVAFKVGNKLLGQVAEKQAKIEQQIKEQEVLKRRLGNVEGELIDLAIEIEIQQDSLMAGDRRLEAQSGLIKARAQEISRRNKELKGIVRIIEYQEEALIFLIVFAALFVTAVFLYYRAYQVKMRFAKQLNEQKEELDELLKQLRTAQEQLILSEKLGVVGDLTESFANEISNAINYVYSGIHIIRDKVKETQSIMSQIQILDADDSHLKMKMKVREISEQKREFDYDSYEKVMETMASSILVGADRITNILKDLKPYTQYSELGKVGLALLGRNEGEKIMESPISRRLRNVSKGKGAIPKSTEA